MNANVFINVAVFVKKKYEKLKDIMWCVFIIYINKFILQLYQIK